MRRNDAIAKLRAHEAELRDAGVVALSVFGSVARDDAGDASDVDVLVRLDDAVRYSGFRYFGRLATLSEQPATSWAPTSTWWRSRCARNACAARSSRTASLPSEHPALRFADIIDNIERVEQFTAGMDLAAFVAQGPVVYAVQYALIISEAARKLGPNAEVLAPDQPWADIRGIGNILRHQYDEVDPEVIWSVVQRDLGALKAAAQRALLAVSDNGTERHQPGP